jgi:hypothetical protein
MTPGSNPPQIRRTASSFQQSGPNPPYRNQQPSANQHSGQRPDSTPWGTKPDTPRPANRPWGAYPQRDQQRDQHRLHQLGGDEPIEEQNQYENYWEEDEPYDEGREDDNPDDHADHELSALPGVPQRAPPETMACFDALYNGTCTKQNCRFSHDPALLQRTNAVYQRNLSSLSGNYASRQPSGVSRHQPQSILRRPTATTELNAMEMADGEEMDPMLQSLLQDYVGSVNPNAGWTPVHTEGKIILPSGVIDISKALYDSGAHPANYINAPFVEEHRAQLAPFLRRIKLSPVQCAGLHCKAPCSEHLTVTMQFNDAHGKPYDACIRLYVMELHSNDVILGLPDVCRYFGDIYTAMIASAIELYSEAGHLAAIAGDAPIYPWTIAPAEPAPEELEAPDPCSFSGPVHHLNITHDEACAEFMELVKTHVAPDFLAHPGMQELIETKMMQVCCPTGWSGITGIPPIELNWKENFPEYHKPAMRNINPKLYEASQKEFDHMLTYFYEPFHSPVASPLVVARKATKPHIRFCGDYVHVNKFINLGHHPIPHVRSSLEYVLCLDFSHNQHYICSYCKTLL